MPNDEGTYGFNRQDAEQIIDQLSDGYTEVNEGWHFPGGPGGVSNLVQTPGGGIAARSGSTLSSADCTVYRNVSGTATSQSDTISVANPWPFAIPASMYIMATKDTFGDWFANHPGVTNVRWVDPDLEQTFDGSSYSTIDTAEDCS